MAIPGRMKTAMLAGAALGAIGAGTIPAHGGGFFLHEQSAYFQGTSFAGAAAGGPSLSSMFWNPATITQQGLGLSSETSAAVVFARTDILPITATSSTGANLVPLGASGDVGKDAFVPASYYVYGINNLITIGMGLNAGFGLRTQPNPLWAGLFYSQESEVWTLNATPTIAFKITDWLSIGVGAQIEYFKVKLNSAFPGSGSFPPFVAHSPAAARRCRFHRLRLDGRHHHHADAVDHDRPRLPLAPRSFYRRRRFPPAVHPSGGGDPGWHSAAFVNFEATVPLPDIATISIRQKIYRILHVARHGRWQNWSRLGTVPVTVTSTTVTPLGIPTALAFEWQDGWLVSGGVEYQWSPKMALRGGIGFERSPIDDRVRGTRLPDNDRLWVSVGASYNWNERLSFDFGYSHIFVDDTPINLVPGNPTFNPALGTFVGTANAQVDIVSFALRYRWLPPAAAPLITKG